MKINARDGETFKIAGMEFIKFPSEGEATPVVAKNILFNSKFGRNNDLRSSKALKRMEAEILPEVIAEIGEENVLTFQTDLMAEDGLKPYETMESKVSLPTLDFYRANVKIFDQHKVNNWWWLATPESAQPHSSDSWILCVSPSGRIYYDGYNNGCGVRPFFKFKSSIFESFGE